MFNKFEKKDKIVKRMVKHAIIGMVFGQILAFTLYYSLFYHDFKERFRERLVNLADAAALMIDYRDHNKLESRADEKTFEYLKDKEILKNFKKANKDILYIYTMRKTDKKGILEFVVDADESENLSHIGDIYDASNVAAMQQGFIAPTSDQDFVTDSWGTTLSGYAPIKDNKGETVAIVGVDVDATTLRKNLEQLFKGTIIILLIDLSLGIFVVTKSLNNFMIPFYKIMDGIKEIKSGNRGFRFNIKTNDEFEEIGELIDSTVEVFFHHQEILEKDLIESKEQTEKIFKVYKEVIFAVTQGKFNLLSQEELLLITSVGDRIYNQNVAKIEDINRVREEIASILEPDFKTDRLNHICLAISEAATNIVKHAGIGTVKIIKADNYIRLIFDDQGAGMDYDNLSKMIFFKGFSTKISLGMGFNLIYKFSNKIYLFTSNKGTFLALDFYKD